MTTAGKIYLESGEIQNAVCVLTEDGLEFISYDGLRILSLTDKDLIDILKDNPSYLATIIAMAD